MKIAASNGLLKMAEARDSPAKTMLMKEIIFGEIPALAINLDRVFAHAVWRLFKGRLAVSFSIDLIMHAT